MMNSKRDAQTTTDNLINNAVVNVHETAFVKPKVGRAPNKPTNSASLPIQYYFYSQNKVNQYQQDRRLNQSLLNQEISAKPQAHHTSRTIIINFNRETYVLLFTQFHAHQHRLISSNQINLAD